MTRIRVNFDEMRRHPSMGRSVGMPQGDGQSVVPVPQRNEYGTGRVVAIPPPDSAGQELKRRIHVPASGAASTGVVLMDEALIIAALRQGHPVSAPRLGRWIQMRAEAGQLPSPELMEAMRGRPEAHPCLAYAVYVLKWCQANGASRLPPTSPRQPAAQDESPETGLYEGDDLGGP